MRLDRLSAALRFRLARRLGRRELAVSGDWGRFVGRSDDCVMLRHYGRHGTWSRAVVDLLAETARRLAPTGPVHLLDVGAGIGLVAVGVARQAPVTVQAFEPDPDAFGFLQRNLQAAGVAGRIAAERWALGDPLGVDTKVSLRRHPGNGGDTRLAPLGATDLVARLARLDDVVAAPAGARLLIKVDVQGAEPEVLGGAAATLAQAELLVVEFWPHGLRCRGHDPKAFARELVRAARRLALLRDEHRPQPVLWQEPGALLPALEELAQTRRPDEQAELLLEPLRD